jgi:K+-sensing histidine kinase KdpD
VADNRMNPIEMDRERAAFPLTLVRAHLGAVLDALGLLRARLVERHDIDFLLDEIDSQARQAVTSIVNCEDYERVVDGELALYRERLMLNDVVRKVVERKSSWAKASGVTLQRELAANLPSLSLDGHWIERAVANLLANAIASSPPRDTIELKTFVANDRVALSITNARPALDETRPEHDLALYLAWQIVTIHGGDLRMEFPPYGGGTFEMSFPVQRPEGEPAAGR